MEMVAVLRESKQAILRFIQEYMAEHTWAPTVREIGAGVGLTISTVHSHLLDLNRLGYIELGFGSRTIRFPRSKSI